MLHRVAREVAGLAFQLAQQVAGLVAVLKDDDVALLDREFLVTLPVKVLDRPQVLLLAPLLLLLCSVFLSVSSFVRQYFQPLAAVVPPSFFVELVLPSFLRRGDLALSDRGCAAVSEMIMMLNLLHDLCHCSFNPLII